MNLGGYDKNDFNEADGNVILKNFLHTNKLLFCHFSEQDKTPNFDGYFEILEKGDTKNIPIGKIEVQIKTLNTDYSNLNKTLNCSQYKYSCETKIFNAVKKAITFNPCYLFMVDTKNKRIFAKYISLEYVLELQLDNEENKTIYFNDTDEIIDINSFYDYVKNIYFKRKEEQKDMNSNKFLVTNNLTEVELLKLQEEFDYLNGIFDSELSFVKKKLYPKVWKFGLAYLKNENSVGIGIYYICKGKDEKYFKRLDSTNHTDCTYISIRYNKDENIHLFINKFISIVLEKIYKNKILPMEFVADDILNEIAFHFLDKIASIEKEFENPTRPCVYYKDIEEVSKLSHYFNVLKQYAYNKNQFYLKKIPNGYFISDPMEEITRGINFKENKENLCELLKNNNPITENISKILLRGTFEYALIEETINELKNRNINEVYRVWNSKNWLEFEKRRTAGIKRIENGYEISEYFENIKKLINNLPIIYNSFISNFRNIEDFLKIKKKYVYGFSNNEDFDVDYIEYNNEIFSTEIDDSICNISEEDKEKFFEEKNAIYITSSNCSRVFDLKFPMLMYLNYLFIHQLAKKYEISDLNLGDSIEILL